MRKVIRIGTQKEYNRRGNEVQAPVYCKIEFKDNKLSISGVIAPLSNGDALGSCGQIYDSIEVSSFAKGWNKTKLKKFINVWKDWHLNDTCAYSVDMKKAGWDKLASKEIFKYSFSRIDKCQKEYEDLEKKIIETAIEGKRLSLTPRQKRLLKSERWSDVFGYKQPKNPEFMELDTDYRTKQPKIEKKTLGWVDVKEHKDGLLCRKLNPEDKNGYGQTWFFHEVPSEVIEFLNSLPETDKTPAWV